MATGTLVDKTHLDYASAKRGLLTDNDPRVQAYRKKLLQNKDYGTSRREVIKKLKDAGLKIA